MPEPTEYLTGVIESYRKQLAQIGDAMAHAVSWCNSSKLPDVAREIADARSRVAMADKRLEILSTNLTTAPDQENRS